MNTQIYVRLRISEHTGRRVVRLYTVQHLFIGTFIANSKDPNLRLCKQLLPLHQQLHLSFLYLLHGKPLSFLLCQVLFEKRMFITTQLDDKSEHKKSQVRALNFQVFALQRPKSPIIQVQESLFAQSRLRVSCRLLTPLVCKMRLQQLK
jgi:hypothetical protein